MVWEGENYDAETQNHTKNIIQVYYSTTVPGDQWLKSKTKTTLTGLEPARDRPN